MRVGPGRWATSLVLVVAFALVASGCSASESAAPTNQPSTPTGQTSVTVPTTSTESTVTVAPSAPGPVPARRTVAVDGVVVSAVDGQPLDGATVTADQTSMTTGGDGQFSVEATSGSTITVERAAWRPITVDVAGAADLTVELEPFTVRGLRVAADVAADPTLFEGLLTMADQSVVNTLVFDTKDEEDRVLYDSQVELARAIGAVQPLYDPAELLAKARDHDLYTVTRIVTFEDRLWADGVPEAKLALDWVDASDRANWDYPLDLAVEACRLGFDEIQFDYVRYPEGRAARAARDLGAIPATTDERAAVIGDFLAEARDRLAPDGCAVSAAIFGVVMSSPGDEGIGQTVEAVSASVDVVSPMIYPSHYGPGWIGLDDPNNHPGPVVAHALDGGIPRLAPGTLMRPWIQAFFYNENQIKAQIDEIEQRGGGWILWNFYSRYNPDWLPTGDES